MLLRNDNANQTKVKPEEQEDGGEEDGNLSKPMYTFCLYGKGGPSRELK